MRGEPKDCRHGWTVGHCAHCDEVNQLTQDLAVANAKIEQARDYIENVGLVGQTWSELESERTLLAILSRDTPEGNNG